MSTPLQPASDEKALGKPLEGWRLRLYTIIFEADTRAGQLFDRWLIAVILLSLAVVVAGSVNALQVRFETPFTVMEWLFTVIFTLEYVARLVCVRHPLRYATSFFGIVDLLAILPTYLALLVPEMHALIDVRVLRLLRCSGSSSSRRICRSSSRWAAHWWPAGARSWCSCRWC
jgi:voltage-gated potassium channel